MDRFSAEANVDAKFIEFVKTHPGDLRSLLLEVDRLQGEMENKIDLVRERSDSFLHESNIPTTYKCAWNWKEAAKKREPEWKYLMFWSYGVRLRVASQFVLVIEARLYLVEGWEIQVFELRQYLSGREQNHAREWLKEKGIETRGSRLDPNKRLAYGDVLPYETNPQEVIDRFCELIRRVDKARS